MKDILTQKGTFKSFDGTEIYYEVRGEGKPVVFAYGIACLINHWHHQVKYFSQEYQTIVFDYRGHHKSEVPSNPENLSMDDLSNDIIELLKHLNIKSAHFCGHSFGVPVLLNAYNLNPEMFNSLILLNGFSTNPFAGMFGTDVTQYIFQALKTLQEYVPDTTSFLWKKLLDSQVAAILLSLAGGFNLNLTEFKDIEAYVKGLSNLPIDSLITMFEHMVEYDGAEVCKKITHPTFILGGAKDLVTPVRHQLKLHKAINGSQFVSVPYGTHCTQLDLPEFVNLKIEKFMRDIDSI